LNQASQLPQLDKHNLFSQFTNIQKSKSQAVSLLRCRRQKSILRATFLYTL